ncbi:excalibur calcium-binding domain-containing protein [Streptomyces sp. NPDC051320]|uniref:excalibur calcium-binding domain-containing protein n=1 Tax=Streptomyces sp. NPDC051320 TaxID=3154644 RepID=UPI003418035B
MSDRRALFLLAAFLLAAPVALVGCGGTDSSSTPSGAATVTRTVSSPAAPSSRATVTVQPPASTHTAPPAGRSAADTVTAYYAAINAKDFRTAWNMGGRHFAPSYSAFVAGFAGLAHDDVTVLSSSGHTVTLELEAVQTDGSAKVFEGTMSVSGGEITGANIHEVTGPEPTGPASYKNCTDAHRHGVYDIPRSSPAYRPALDRDGDGIACEHYEGN